jgi:hypothetical protein
LQNIKVWNFASSQIPENGGAEKIWSVIPNSTYL